MKRNLWIILILTMMLGLLCCTAAAADSSGACGENLTWTLDDNGLLTISGTGNMPDYSSWSELAPWYDLHAEIQAVIIGDGVTSIGQMAFYECSSITDVTLPNSLTSIGDAAFVSCSSLAGITLPGSVTMIGSEAFSNCFALTDLMIPNSVTNIGEDAFWNCYGLANIAIPDSVTNIGKSAFAGCRSLTDITVSSGNQVYASLDGVLFNKQGSELVCYPANKEGHTYTIPDSVTRIRDSAFYGCTGLTDIIIPDSVTDIGSSAFPSCTSLTAITIPGSITSIKVGTFSNCSSLTSITIPNSVENIEFYVFYSCYNLMDIYYTGTAVQWSAISKEREGNECLGRAEVHFNSPVVVASGTCGDHLNWMLNNTGTLTISGSGEMAGHPWTAGDINQVIIEKGTATIDEQAFFGCDRLTNMTIPDSVTGIGAEAFSGCVNLAYIIIPDSVDAIGENAFHNCSGLSDVYYGGTVEQWSAAAIGEGNDPLAAAEIHYRSHGPEPVPIASGECGTEGSNLIWTLDSHGLLAISGTGEMTDYNFQDQPWFSYIDSVRFVTIDSGVTSIGRSAFYECHNMEEIIIPDTVTLIGEEAFSNCRNLTSVTIPEGITEIANYTFSGCRRLTALTIPDNVTRIGLFAFMNCVRLESITIPDSVTSFGEYAFANCSSLKSIRLPDSLAWLNVYLFENCTRLEEIILPNSITSISWAAFKSCISLSSITIPNSVTTINGQAFQGCTNLAYIVLPDSITQIASEAFSGCSRLTDVYFTGTQEEWSDISVESYNDPLLNAEIHYNYCISVDSGTCGESLTWTLSREGVLTISGNGAMYDYEAVEYEGEFLPPWIAYRNNIRSVVIESGVTGIGECAFFGFSALADVNMADSICSVGAETFRYCTALVNVHFSAGLTDLGNCVFNGCTSLTSVTLPAALQSVGRMAFAECGLTSVNTEGEGKTWDFFYALDSGNYLYHITLPAGADEIAADAFYDNPLTHDEPDLILPADLDTIEAEAFSGIAAEFVLLTDQLTAVGSKAFVGSSVRYVYIPLGCGPIAPDAFPTGTVILGIPKWLVESSYAQAYAEENGYEFIGLENPYAGNG